MKVTHLTLFITCLIGSRAYAQTFNHVEKSKNYKMEVTGVPQDFEDEEIDPEEAKLYNKGHESEVLDEYDIPEVVDEDREVIQEKVDYSSLKKKPVQAQTIKN